MLLLHALRSTKRTRQCLPSDCCLLYTAVLPGTVVCIPDQPPSALMPPGGVLHKTFPPLILSEYSERSQGLKRRKTAASRQKRPSVGRRRAISELMVGWQRWIACTERDLIYLCCGVACRMRIILRQLGVY